jgi:hypothetical protein
MDNDQLPAYPGPSTSPEQPVPPQQPAPQHSPEPTDVLGIISLVMFAIFPLAGLILGIVGQRKAKKAGYKATFSTIGIILNAIAIVLFFFLVAIFIFAGTQSGIQGRARDTERKVDAVSIGKELEEFYSINRYYPALAELQDEQWLNQNLPELDQESLKAPGQTENSVGETASPTSYKYAAIPATCTTENKDCERYIITITLESEDNTPVEFKSIGEDATTTEET